MSKTIRSRVLKAVEEPVLVTEQGKPILVVRSLLEDDVVDELIVQHPDFEASVERARQQKAAGQVKTLAEVRQKYALKESPQ
jgi:hypothetical protein